MGGFGVTGQLGTLTRADGTTQVTYAGKPLYYWQGDTKPGDATGNGVTGAWHVITGAVLSPSPSSAAAASLRDASPAASATPTATASGYGGY